MRDQGAGALWPKEWLQRARCTGSAPDSGQVRKPQRKSMFYRRLCREPTVGLRRANTRCFPLSI